MAPSRCRRLCHPIPAVPPATAPKSQPLGGSRRGGCGVDFGELGGEFRWEVAILVKLLPGLGLLHESQARWQRRCCPFASLAPVPGVWLWGSCSSRGRTNSTLTPPPRWELSPPPRCTVWELPGCPHWDWAGCGPPCFSLGCAAVKFGEVFLGVPSCPGAARGSLGGRAALTASPCSRSNSTRRCPTSTFGSTCTRS